MLSMEVKAREDAADATTIVGSIENMRLISAEDVSIRMLHLLDSKSLIN